MSESSNRTADNPDVIKYILGEGTLLGCWWGEKPNWIGTPSFWWRKVFREMVVTNQELREENERLKEKEIRGDRMIVDLEHCKTVQSATIKELVEVLEDVRSSYSEYISFDHRERIDSIFSKVNNQKQEG